MSSAKQNIERAKGAKAERRWLAAQIRALIKLYGKDLMLSLLLADIKERDVLEAKSHG